METDPVLRVDKVQPPRKQVKRVDKSMDPATKITIAKRKQSVPRVDKKSKSTKTTKTIIATPTLIVNQTQA